MFDSLTVILLNGLGDSPDLKARELGLVHGEKLPRSSSFESKPPGELTDSVDLEGDELERDG
jgi:hypothetical protein